jgi:hypothetical protein
MQSRNRALFMSLALLAAAGSARAQVPPPTISSTHASVTIKGRPVNGSFTYDKLGDLTMWGPGGGLIDIQSERGDTFQYSPFARPGKYKTTVAQPLVVQVGVGPTLKVIASAAGECTITVTRADDTGVSGSFDCGRVAVLGPEKRILGAIDSMTGTFTATR